MVNGFQKELFKARFSWGKLTFISPARLRRAPKIRELWKKTRYRPSDLRSPNSCQVPQVLVDWSHSYSRTVVKESPKSGGEHGALTEVTNGNVNPGIHLNVNECESFLFVVLCFLPAIKLPNESTSAVDTSMLFIQLTLKPSTQARLRIGPRAERPKSRVICSWQRTFFPRSDRIPLSPASPFSPPQTPPWQSSCNSVLRRLALPLPRKLRARSPVLRRCWPFFDFVPRAWRLRNRYCSHV